MNVPSISLSPHKKSGWIAACAVALLLFFLAWRFIDAHWPYRYRNVQPLLQRIFASQVKIDHYHQTYLPRPGFVADGLTLSRNSAPNLPPVGSARHLTVEGSWIDLLLLRDKVRLVSVGGLHVVIPPAGSPANKQDFPPGSSSDFTGPTTFVVKLDIINAALDIMRDDGSRSVFPIRRLEIENLQMGRPVSYLVDMQNARPAGRIQAHGSFGPLVASQLAATPVAGEFSFSPVTLSDIGGISGTLSATGRFQGSLASIEASASSTTPNFAVGRGRPTPVSATARGSVNGLNGDIILHAIDLHTGSTTIHARGAILGRPKVTQLDLSVQQGRAQDILRPFLHSEVPVTGDVRLHSHAFIAGAARRQTFLQRLNMNGAFDIPAERLTNRSTEYRLTTFSQRAQGLPSKSSSETGPPSASDVVSGLGGGVTIRDGVAYAHRLIFQVPGATVALNGTFNLRNQDAHLLGDLRMQSNISHVTTGFKSFLLKPLAPFFKKPGAGTVLPIAITGAPGRYKVSQNILHHK